MIRTDDKNKTNILKAVNMQLKNLREQGHTEDGEIFAIQAVLADLQHAISVFTRLKDEWTDRLPINPCFTDEEWEEAATEVAIPSVDAAYLPTGTCTMDAPAYRELCANVQSRQLELATLLTGIKEYLSDPPKEKLEAFYNTLITDYAERFKEKERKKLWRKIRDAADDEEKLEILQMLKEERRRVFMESGFLGIKAGKLSVRKYKTDEERLQAAHDSFFLASGKPKVKAVWKYIFFHKAELKDAQVRAWLHYDLMLKIIDEEAAYKSADAKQTPAEGEGQARVVAEMGEALKTLYLPRCYTLLAKGYDAAWVDTFVDSLLASEHAASLCADWQVDKKRPQVVAAMLGLLVEANAIQGGNAEIARVYNGGKDDRTFAKYVGNGRKSDYADWAMDYDLKQE